MKTFNSQQLSGDDPIWIESLRMSDATVRKLLERWGHGAAQGSDDERRRYERLRYYRRVSITLDSDADEQQTFTAISGNISRGGMALAVGRFVYADSGITISLALPDGKSMRVTGKVLRCQFLEGRAHEVVILFDSPLPLDLLEAVVKTPLPKPARARQAGRLSS